MSEKGCRLLLCDTQVGGANHSVLAISSKPLVWTGRQLLSGQCSLRQGVLAVNLTRGTCGQADNLPARAFFERNGFSNVEVRGRGRQTSGQASRRRGLGRQAYRRTWEEWTMREGCYVYVFMCACLRLWYGVWMCVAGLQNHVYYSKPLLAPQAAKRTTTMGKVRVDQDEREEARGRGVCLPTTLCSLCLPIALCSNEFPLPPPPQPPTQSGELAEPALSGPGRRSTCVRAR